MEDAQIIKLFLRRDESAVSETAAQYGKRLRTLSLQITQDAMTAEECENDTYLEAWNRIPPHEPYSYFYPFLARITRHLAIDHCRQQQSSKRNGILMELTEEMHSVLPSPEDVECIMDARLLGEAVSRFLQMQPKEKRILFLRRYFYADSIADAAARLHLTESNAKTTLFRIRNDLKAYLIQEGLL